MEENNDLIDTLIAQWSHERPDLDASAMGIVGRIIYLATRYRASAGEALTPFNLSYTDLDILATLRREGSPFVQTPTDLMGAILLSSGAMTAALSRLAKRGLISREQDQTDKRIKAVRLSNAGESLIDKAIEARFEEAGTVVAGLSKSDADTLQALLRKLTLDTQ